MSAVKVAEFEMLFGEFASSYLPNSSGRAHLDSYERIRSEALTNWQMLSDAAEHGADITKDVLLKLLPWADTAANQRKGAWVHVAPAITGDLTSWFENVGWTRSQDWPEVSRAIFGFVRKCISNPAELSAACAEFAALPQSKGFQSGMLSPILNALNPEAFLIMNSKSRVAINHFAGASFGLQLLEYPAANSVGRELLAEIAPVIGRLAGQSERIEDAFDAFTHWLTSIKGYDFGSTGYWKVAPGEAAHLWDRCREGGFICIGWEELGDLTGLTYPEFSIRRDDLLPQHADWTKDAVEQVWTFAHIQEGDRIVANRGTTEVVGLGTVTGPYYFVNDGEYRHRLPVQWDDIASKKVGKGGWRRTLLKLSRKEFEEVKGAVPAQGDTLQSPFTPRAFELLAGLHADPTNAYYQAHKHEFAEHLELPFKELFVDLAVRLPPHARQALETTKHVLSRVPKNDYGKGGAWDFLWGAFYPKGTGRTRAPQLFVGIHHAVLEYGFYVGEYGQAHRARLKRRLRDSAADITAALADRLASAQVMFGRSSRHQIELGEAPTGNDNLLASWLDDAEAGDFRAAAVLSRDEVLKMSRAQVVDVIGQAFEFLYPLVRLASEETPVADILGGLEAVEADETETQPPYSLQQLAAETDLDLELLERWAGAIERKGQAVIYGPPGTGKTYVAQRLARYLVAGGDGFVAFVQFHPSYSYEDFMEGIRPQTRPDGGLSYEWVPGRFLDFCLQALGRKDRCVLLIDEINRANLSRVLGELMYLLEYREPENEIPLASGRRLWIPENVRVIGTMNTADRSIALVDHALRRRFAFLTLRPNYEVLRKYYAGALPIEGLIGVLAELNDAIGNPDYSVGITYFLNDKLGLEISAIWEMEIEPYLEEYFFDRPEDLARFRWQQVKSKIGF